MTTACINMTKPVTGSSALKPTATPTPSPSSASASAPAQAPAVATAAAPSQPKETAQVLDQRSILDTIDKRWSISRMWPMSPAKNPIEARIHLTYQKDNRPEGVWLDIMYKHDIVNPTESLLALARHQLRESIETEIKLMSDLHTVILQHDSAHFQRIVAEACEQKNPSTDELIDRLVSGPVTIVTDDTDGELCKIKHPFTSANMIELLQSSKFKNWDQVHKSGYPGWILAEESILCAIFTLRQLRNFLSLLKPDGKGMIIHGDFLDECVDRVRDALIQRHIAERQQWPFSGCTGVRIAPRDGTPDWTVVDFALPKEAKDLGQYWVHFARVDVDDRVWDEWKAYPALIKAAEERNLDQVKSLLSQHVWPAPKPEKATKVMPRDQILIGRLFQGFFEVYGDDGKPKLAKADYFTDDLKAYFDQHGLTPAKGTSSPAELWTLLIPFLRRRHEWTLELSRSLTKVLHKAKAAVNPTVSPAEYLARSKSRAMADAEAKSAKPAQPTKSDKPARQTREVRPTGSTASSASAPARSPRSRSGYQNPPPPYPGSPFDLVSPWEVGFDPYHARLQSSHAWESQPPPGSYSHVYVSGRPSRQRDQYGYTGYRGYGEL